MISQKGKTAGLVSQRRKSNMTDILTIGKNAKEASHVLASAKATTINHALRQIADQLIEQSEKILEANAEDLKKAEENGIGPVMADRLRLTQDRIRSIADGVRQVEKLPSPVGEILSMDKLENGLTVGRMRVPFGVIGVIYESRPNVTVDAAVLTLKAGSAVILRGGKEAIRSNITIANIMRSALADSGLPSDCIQIIEDTDRATATALMKLNGYIDLLIPRGGHSLIQNVTENATVPVIRTGEGNCHIYCDEGCDHQKAVSIIVNAKTQRPSVCNAAESLLIHEKEAKTLLPKIKKALDEKHTEIRGCKRTGEIIECTPATEEDYFTEYLDYIISCKVVSSLEEAISHINTHSTGHSEAIITETYDHAMRFLREIDSAAVYVNASTRFTDGNQFGLGAEIGISNQKLHARGPLGLKEITTTKFIVLGDGQIRQ